MDYINVPIIFFKYALQGQGQSSGVKEVKWGQRGEEGSKRASGVKVCQEGSKR